MGSIELCAIATIQLNPTKPNLIFMLKFLHFWSAAITNDDFHPFRSTSIRQARLKQYIPFEKVPFEKVPFIKCTVWLSGHLLFVLIEMYGLSAYEVTLGAVSYIHIADDLTIIDCLICPYLDSC